MASFGTVAYLIKRFAAKTAFNCAHPGSVKDQKRADGNTCVIDDASGARQKTA